MNGTKTYSDIDLQHIVEHPNVKANEIGSRPPYHIQYLRDGGVDIKPEVNHAGTISNQ